jgi:hypothetical protein
LTFELAGYGFVAFAIARMVATRRRRTRLSAVLWIAAWLMFAFGFYEWFTHESGLCQRLTSSWICYNSN